MISPGVSDNDLELLRPVLLPIDPVSSAFTAIARILRSCLIDSGRLPALSFEESESGVLNRHRLEAAPAAAPVDDVASDPPAKGDGCGVRALHAFSSVQTRDR